MSEAANPTPSGATPSTATGSPGSSSQSSTPQPSGTSPSSAPATGAGAAQPAAEAKPASLKDIVKAAGEKSSKEAKPESTAQPASPAPSSGKETGSATSGAPPASQGSPPPPSDEKPADPDAAHLAAIVEAERRNAAESRRIAKERETLAAEKPHIDRGKAVAEAAAKGDPLAVLKAAGLALDHGLVYKLAQALPDGEGETPATQAAPDVDKLVETKLQALQKEQQTQAQAASKQQFVGYVKDQIQRGAGNFPRLHVGGQEAVERVDARFLEMAQQNGGQAPPLPVVLDAIETDMAVEEIAGGKEQIEALPIHVERAFAAAMDKYPGIKAEGMTPASVIAYARQVARAERRVPTAQQVLDAAEAYWRAKYLEKNPYGNTPRPPSPGTAAATPSAGTPGEKAPTSLRERVNADIEKRRVAR